MIRIDRLSGKCKDAFEEWYDNQTEFHSLCEYNQTDSGACYSHLSFLDLPNSIREGILLSFFRSKICKLVIDISYYKTRVEIIDYETEDGNEVITKIDLTHYELNEYFDCVIEKANKIFNNRK